MSLNNFDRIKMVLVDLDGTLLNNSGLIGSKDKRTLHFLGEQKIIRVFATGRNLFSAQKVLSTTTPFDYLVFSSGAGVYDWKKQKLLFSSSIEKKRVNIIIGKLIEFGVSFSIQLAIPENHKYFYYKGNTNNTDFEWRNEIYRNYNKQLKTDFQFDVATQFIVIMEDMSLFELLRKKFNECNLKIIRATSPLDNKSVWMEIFNNNVSKAKGGQFIAKIHNINRDSTVAIGNDYNDLDMLKWASKCYVVENSPDDLKDCFECCKSNQDNPLTDVIFSKLAV